MKYIRTDGNHIYERVEQRIMKSIFGGEQYRHNLNSRWENIIEEAETIDKLCDLVRFKTKDNVTHYIDLHKNTIEDIVIHFGGKNIIIDSFRYCIETDKGLIFVAKLNKGELELL